MMLTIWREGDVSEAAWCFRRRLPVGRGTQTPADVPAEETPPALTASAHNRAVCRRLVCSEHGEVDRAAALSSCVFDEHAQAVLAFLNGAVGSSEAEDCFQETMLSALRAYPRLGDASNLRGWLFTIARRKAIDAHRARARRPDARRRPDPGAACDPLIRDRRRALGSGSGLSRSNSARLWCSASPATGATPRSPRRCRPPRIRRARACTRG